MDVIAGCRRHGGEAWVSLDYRDLRERIHPLHVRKAIAETRALVLTAGRHPSWGVLSNVSNFEALRRRYGVQVERRSFDSFTAHMDAADPVRARELAAQYHRGAGETRIAEADVEQDMRY